MLSWESSLLFMSLPEDTLPVFAIQYSGYHTPSQNQGTKGTLRIHIRSRNLSIFTTITFQVDTFRCSIVVRKKTQLHEISQACQVCFKEEFETRSVGLLIFTASFFVAHPSSREATLSQHLVRVVQSTSLPGGVSNPRLRHRGMLLNGKKSQWLCTFVRIKINPHALVFTPRH